MSLFARNQEQMRQYMSSLGGLFPFGQQFEEMGKQNMALFAKTLKMFSPFPQNSEAKTDQPTTPPAAGGDGASLKELTDRLNALQNQLEELSKKPKP
jgi:polyhydroxyalkanoate synthesis regulator protein